MAKLGKITLSENQENKEKENQITKNYYKLIEVEHQFKKEGIDAEIKALEITNNYFFKQDYQDIQTNNIEKIVSNGKNQKKKIYEKFSKLKKIDDYFDKIKTIDLNRSIIENQIFDKIYQNKENFKKESIFFENIESKKNKEEIEKDFENYLYMKKKEIEKEKNRSRKKSKREKLQKELAQRYSLLVQI